ELNPLQYKEQEHKHKDRVVGFLIVLYQAQLVLKTSFAYPGHFPCYGTQALHGFGDLQDLMEHFIAVREAHPDDFRIRSGVQNLIVTYTLPSSPELRTGIEQ